MGLLDPDRERRPSSYEMLIDAIDQLDFSEIASDTAEFSVGPLVAAGTTISEEPTLDQDLQTKEKSFAANTRTTEYPIPLEVEQTGGSKADGGRASEDRVGATQSSETPNPARSGDRRSRNLRVLVGLGVLVVLLLTLVVINWVGPAPRGPRELKRVVSNEPLYDGRTLAGWGTDGSMVGAWNTVEAPDSSEAIACTTNRGALTRRLPDADFFRISLFVWVQEAGGVVDIDFASDFTQAAGLRGTLRFDGSEILLGTKSGDFEEVSVVGSLALPAGFSERYHVVYIERQTKDWYVFLERELVGTIPIATLPGGSALRVVVHGNAEGGDSGTGRGGNDAPRVFFSDFQLSKLAEELSPAQPESIEQPSTGD
jgi:hypothetical protein